MFIQGYFLANKAKDPKMILAFNIEIKCLVSGCVFLHVLPIECQCLKTNLKKFSTNFGYIHKLIQ